MNTVQKGAEQAVKKCMKIKKKDKVIIVTDKKINKVAASVFKECKKITNNVKKFVLEDFSSRPVKKLPEEIRKAAEDSTAVFYMAHSYPGEKTVLRLPLVRLGVKNGRQAHMPDITAEIMKQGMNADYDKIKKISKKVYDLVSKAKEIRVTTKKGTDFTVKFNKKWRWIIADGDISKKGKWSNLPDGEVFTCPLDFNGHVVIDGCVGDYFIEYGKLKTPIIMEVENCRVKTLKSKNKKLESSLRKYIKQDKNASRVGEFAIGTNIGLKKIIGNLLQDEKFPGIHFAVGDSYPKETGAPFPSKAHCDLVVCKTTIFVEGEKIMEEGKYII